MYIYSYIHIYDAYVGILSYTYDSYTTHSCPDIYTCTHTGCDRTRPSVLLGLQLALRGLCVAGESYHEAGLMLRVLKYPYGMTIRVGVTHPCRMGNVSNMKAIFGGQLYAFHSRSTHWGQGHL